MCESGNGNCSGSKRKHTPIVSEAQQGKFGAELSRRRKGEKSQMKGITEKELENHLEESGGKKLPKKVKKVGSYYGSRHS